MYISLWQKSLFSLLSPFISLSLRGSSVLIIQWFRILFVSLIFFLQYLFCLALYGPLQSKISVCLPHSIYKGILFIWIIPSSPFISSPPFLFLSLAGAHVSGFYFYLPLYFIHKWTHEGLPSSDLPLLCFLAACSVLFILLILFFTSTLYSLNSGPRTC
jgi:hypothetical protein